MNPTTVDVRSSRECAGIVVSFVGEMVNADDRGQPDFRTGHHAEHPAGAGYGPGIAERDAVAQPGPAAEAPGREERGS